MGRRLLGFGLPQPLHILLRDLLEKAGGHSGAGTAVQGALPGIGEGQLLLGTGHGHVAQSPLLLHLLLIPHGPVAGEQAVLHAHHEHAWKLQPLGAVHGHEGNAVVGVRLTVQIRI